ncbi:MAG: hypothetical protein SOV56_03065 [Phascolarctobacterium sp.]|nr:hypothetical protein [Phascolarctobacterium sp.]
MLNNIFLSFVLLKLKGRFRGVAMTEYAILLAFIAAIAVVFFIDDYAWNENGPTSLYTAIQYSIMKAWSAIDMAGPEKPLPHP